MLDVTAVTDVTAAHERRLAPLDPLLRRTYPFPEPEASDQVLTCDGGLALLRCQRPDPDSLFATWGAAERHQLSIRVAGPDPTRAMSDLLVQARDRVLPQVGDEPDSEVVVNWPSRDTAMTLTLLAHGLAPATVIAARPAGRPTPPAPDGTRVRPIELGDQAAADLWLQQVRWDTQFGSATERPSTAAALASELRGVLDAHPSWAWVAEVDGEVHGLLVVQPPGRADWVAKLTCADPVAYLSCLVVSAGRRGGGLGAALVGTAHAALDEAGVAVTLLHYAALNPLSAPFWHRCGYRPLWTVWQARPAARFGVTR
jgi:GNAT superfamily N-acetyltransferase